ncbi:MAG: DUF1688 family protein [Gammaproteobacteria bacterium]|nr:DUF1688 family protein [Gammaproteobacteria bacterium]
MHTLLTPEAVRERCNELWAEAERDELVHFRLHPAALDAVVDEVLAEIRHNHPDLKVPVHSRWRHFELGGRDWWQTLRDSRDWDGVDAIARSRFDLAIVSVLLDAGAGATWRYRDRESGLQLGRSEGLALASLRLFESGLLSAAASGDPLRVDATALCALDSTHLARALQCDEHNALLGLPGRCALLNRLGRTLLEQPDWFVRDGDCRPGHLYDALKSRARSGRLPAREILIALLLTLGPIWPNGLVRDGLALGDVGIHPGIRRDDPSNALLPLHKLSQWLSYSLVEPLIDSGIVVTDLDALTGLAEYRNGGLLIDLGVLECRDPDALEREHDPSGPLVVEWRALTVAALDRIAARVRERLAMDETSLPLASVLQGGTWAAGRRVAAQRRASGGPPLRLASDGTLF